MHRDSPSHRDFGGRAKTGATDRRPNDRHTHRRARATAGLGTSQARDTLPVAPDPHGLLGTRAPKTRKNRLIDAKFRVLTTRVAPVDGRSGLPGSRAGRYAVRKPA